MKKILILASMLIASIAQAQVWVPIAGNNTTGIRVLSNTVTVKNYDGYEHIAAAFDVVIDGEQKLTLGALIKTETCWPGVGTIIINKNGILIEDRWVKGRNEPVDLIGAYLCTFVKR